MRFGHRRTARLAVAGAALVAASTACTSGNGATGAPSTVYVTTTPTPAGSSASAPSTAPVPATTVATTTTAATTTARTTPRATPSVATRPIEVSSIEGDGQTYGVGLPVIIHFSVAPTSAAAFEKAATVTVNGRAAAGAWYWVDIFKGIGLEAHYRLASYWPAHSTIAVNLPVAGLSAGRGLAFGNNLTLDYKIGARHVSTVDASKLKMTVTSDGSIERSFTVSLGKPLTPTKSGVKVVWDKQNPQRMVGPGYDEKVPWSTRITSDGEFVHAAAWNHHIGEESTSHGCTNLKVTDAEWFYKFSRIGDIVTYPKTDGKPMPVTQAYGDWNVNWTTYKAGGALRA